VAIERDIRASDHWFVGEDKSLVFTIFKADGVTPQDVSGWTLSWRLKRLKSDADSAALLTKTTSSGIAISGAYNVDPTLNTQVVTVTVADTDTDPIAPGTAYHELKRTNDASETVLAFGAVRLLRGVHRA
jgi:hypothetical protein